MLCVRRSCEFVEVSFDRVPHVRNVAVRVANVGWGRCVLFFSENMNNENQFKALLVVFCCSQLVLALARGGFADKHSVSDQVLLFFSVRRISWCDLHVVKSF